MNEQKSTPRAPAVASTRPGPFGPRPGMIPREKPKNFKQSLWRLARYLKPRRAALIVVAVASLMSTLFAVISPKLLGDATSSIFESFLAGTGVDFTYIGGLLLILIGLYAASSLFMFIQQYMMAGVAQRTVAEMRQEVNEKLARLPLKYYDQHAHGDILSRAINDIDNIQNSFQQAITQIITSVITVLGIIAMMLFISPLLTLVVIVTIPLSAVVIRFIGMRSQKHFVQQQQELGAMNGHVEEMFTGHQVVKAYGYEAESIEKFDEMNERLYTAGWKAQFISGIMMPMMTFVGNIGYVLVCIVGGVLVVNQSIRIGDVQAFIQYSQQISQPMAQAAGIANMIQAALASAERIFKLLDEEEEVEDGQVAQSQSVSGADRAGVGAERGGAAGAGADKAASKAAVEVGGAVEAGSGGAAGGAGADGRVVGRGGANDTAGAGADGRAGGETESVRSAVGAVADASLDVEQLRGHVTFEHVRFSYEADKPIIHDVNLDIREGQTVAIVGPTGAGKTTIINLLMRFYELDSGRLLLDGVDFKDLTREQVRSRFAMVLQDTWLFNGTIRDNIAYGREDATEAEIVEAARNAYADDFIRTLPNGYDTMLGEDASNISQGQRQLLTIARAILSNPTILILDEATSSVDTRTEMNIQKAMKQVMENRTSFVIAHRLSTIREADLILVMNHGDIIEQGTHQELLDANGFYADLYTSQFEVDDAG